MGNPYSPFGFGHHSVHNPRDNLLEYQKATPGPSPSNSVCNCPLSIKRDIYNPDPQPLIHTIPNASYFGANKCSLRQPRAGHRSVKCSQTGGVGFTAHFRIL